MNWNKGGQSATALSNGGNFESFSNETNAVNGDLDVPGTVDSYGLPADPLLNSRIEQGLSTSNTKLDDYSMAVSDDVSRLFDNKGIAKGDYVQMTLSDGTKIVRRYDDALPAVYDGVVNQDQYKLYKGEITGEVISTIKVNPPSGGPDSWENGIPLELQPELKSLK